MSSYYSIMQPQPSAAISTTNITASGYLGVGPNTTTLNATVNTVLLGIDTTSANYALWASGSDLAHPFSVRNDGRVDWTGGTGAGAVFNIAGITPIIQHVGTGTWTLSAGTSSARGQIQFPSTSTASMTFSSATGTLTGPGFTFNRSVVFGVWCQLKTADYTVLSTESGCTFLTTGAAGAVAFTLPAPVQGYEFRFIASAAQTVTVVTPSGSIFGAGSLTGATRTIAAGTASIRYSSFSILCIDGTNYSITGGYGTIT